MTSCHVEFLPGNCSTYNINDNPKINILMSKNIRQKRLKILEHFDTYNCNVIFTYVMVEKTIWQFGSKKNLRGRPL